MDEVECVDKMAGDPAYLSRDNCEIVAMEWLENVYELCPKEAVPQINLIILLYIRTHDAKSKLIVSS